MLRRPATTIKLTPEDILEYDESAHQQQVHQEQERHQFDQFQEHQSDPDSSNLSFKESSHINNQNSVNPPLNRDERIGPDFIRLFKVSSLISTPSTINSSKLKEFVDLL
ncbi:hypothetical protein QCA50_018809 [Cerrena zonata]|uniref:Anaphase-promoting complex subunit CDC26 n=1 Tax=Cerrena zonata TaxID=2478898 RepID=A0AAW0FLW5_9APHY